MPRPNPHARRKRPAPEGDTSLDIRITWQGFKPLLDERGRETKRFYKLETLASATEYAIRRGDSFIMACVQSKLDAAPVATLAFELFLETPAKLIFRVRATDARRKQAVFAFIAAKNVEPYSARLAAEHVNLAKMRARAPEWLLEPLQHGHVYLPDRYRRVSHGREIFAYLAEWPTGFHELGIGKNRCFFVGGEPIQPITAAQTEELKARMVAIVAKTFDAKRRECIDMPDVVAGDFLATRPQSGRLELKLITCRGIAQSMTPARLIHRLVGGSYTWHKTRLRFAPDDPDRLFDGLAQAVGPETALAWLRQYRAAVAAGKMPEQNDLSRVVLDAMGLG